MITQFGSDEDSALQGLTCEAQILYLRCLRRFMDYRTGIVGEARRIDEQAMREIIEFVPVRGSTRQRTRADRSFIRARIDELRRVGLVEDVEREQGARGFVFRLPKAATDQSAQNMNNRRTTAEQPHEQPHEQQRKRKEKQAVSNDEQLSEQTYEKPMRSGRATTPPVSGIRNNQEERKSGSDKSEAKKAPTARGTRLTLETAPADWLDWAGGERPDLDPFATWDRFRDYWVAQPGQKGVKTDWLATWRNWVRRESQQRPNGYRGNGQPWASKQERALEINSRAIEEVLGGKQADGGYFFDGEFTREVPSNDDRARQKALP